MTLEDKKGGSRDPIEAALDEFCEAWFSGKPIDPEKFYNRHSDCGPELRNKVESFLLAAKEFPSTDVTGKKKPSEKLKEGKENLGKKLDDFKILNEIGRGGMATVYKAEQISLKRKVALKILPSHLSFSRDSVKKFQREAEAGARQHHPGIVSIYAVGEHEGYHYIAQELIEGGTTLADRLDELRKKNEQPPGYFRKVAEFISEVSDALEHAHESGVIHRDLKPSNILITHDGKPKVTDFGLAKIEDALSLSRTGDFAGTPYYMSPEQAMSRRIGIDHRTDIYSLGVTLYESITLKRPFEGKTSHEILKQIVLTEPKDARKLNPRVPRDIAVICHMAMEKDPSHRYQKMSELRDDLHRYLQGEVIQAMPSGLGTWVWKRVKRNPVVSAAIGIALAAVVAFAVVVPWILVQKERAIAQKEKENAALLEIEKGKAVAAQKIAETEKDRALAAETEAEEQREIAEKQAQEIQKNYNEIMRLSDVGRLSDLEAEAAALWPAYPENIAGLEKWLTQANEVLDRLERHQQTLASLRKNALPYGDAEAKRDRETHPLWEALQGLKDSKSKLDEQIASLEAGTAAGEGSAERSGAEGSSPDPAVLKEQLAALEETIDKWEKTVSERQTWEFSDTEIQWQHDVLAGLVSGLEALTDEKWGLVNSVQERLAFATTVEEKSLVKHRAAWDEAIASIEDKDECPQYDGLVIEPIIGFVPIGRDPDSGLWEFAHIQTGEVPERGPDGKIMRTEEMGLVFVLIPGGSFNIGAVKPTEDNPKGSPNVDPESRPNESPVHEITLKPFFLSKYEMTQGQWLRFTKINPSNYSPGAKFGDMQHILLRPVEQVSWNDCSEVLSRLNLDFPSESQWEYAARAGSTTVWWTGDEKETLQGAANIADFYCKNNGGAPNWPYEEWMDDGYVVPAPVGSFSPNAFGLHDVVGNVWEWCQDVYGSYENSPIDGSASKQGSSLRVFRGGSWNNVTFHCRSSYRYGNVVDCRSNNLGLRPRFSCP